MRFQLFKNMKESDRKSKGFKLKTHPNFGHKELEILIQLKNIQPPLNLFTDFDDVNNLIQAHNYFDCGGNRFDVYFSIFHTFFDLPEFERIHFFCKGFHFILIKHTKVYTN